MNGYGLKPVEFDEDRLDDLVDVIMSAHGVATSVGGGLTAANATNRERVRAAITGIVCYHVERFADLGEQGIALIVRIAKAHAFADGNKRTAMLTGITFLETYGLPVACSQHDFALAGVAAATGDGAGVRSRLFAGDHDAVQ